MPKGLEFRRVLFRSEVSRTPRKASRPTRHTGDRRNRLKAEFGTARHLYHQATNANTKDLHEHEITYTELFEGETVSIRTELLRTSFRLCLGILDKIALGICELYNIADPTEKLYFESFWQPNAKKGKAGTRWATLKAESDNASLVALYSQATDLGSDGEWRSEQHTSELQSLRHL